MVASPEKFERTIIGLKDDIKLFIDINGIVAQMTDSVMLSGVTTDFILNFNHHVLSICKNSSNKGRAFLEFFKTLNTKKFSTIKFFFYQTLTIVH